MKKKEKEQKINQEEIDDSEMIFNYGSFMMEGLLDYLEIEKEIARLGYQENLPYDLSRYLFYFVEQKIIELGKEKEDSISELKANF